jgi:hypothetical protein
MAAPGAGIDWQSLLTAIEQGQHLPPALQQQALLHQQLQAQSRGPGPGPHGGGGPAHSQGPGHGHVHGHVSHGSHSSHGHAHGHSHHPSIDEDAEDKDTTSSAGSSRPQRGKRKKSGRGSSAASTPGTSLSSPGVETHRYHPAHAEAAAAAEVHAQALAAEAVARNARSPEFLAHFRGTGYIDGGGPGTPTTVKGEQQQQQQQPQLWSGQSPDMTRLALEYGYAAPQHAPPHLISPAQALPMLAPRIPSLPGQTGASSEHGTGPKRLSISTASAAEPSQGPSTSVTSSIPPSAEPTPGPEDAEDKRVRNTLACEWRTASVSVSVWGRIPCCMTCASIPDSVPACLERSAKCISKKWQICNLEGQALCGKNGNRACGGHGPSGVVILYIIVLPMWDTGRPRRCRLQSLDSITGSGEFECWFLGLDMLDRV